jgi:hypothetical protein
MVLSCSPPWKKRQSPERVRGRMEREVPRSTARVPAERYLVSNPSGPMESVSVSDQ